MLPEYVFNKFFPRVKVIVMFVLKLSCLKVYINMLFTREVINGMFFQQIFYMSQSIVMFVLKLSCPEVYINTLFT